MTIILVIGLLGILSACQAAVPLEKYNVDPTQISCSGLSSGSSMASQFHVAYSATIMGVGLIAGTPYVCALSTSCMNYPNNMDISELTDQTDRYANLGAIDPTYNLINARVFVLHGTEDSVVDPVFSHASVEYYQNYVGTGNIESVFDLVAEHNFPTLDYGNLCLVTASPYISRCNYDGAYAILNSIYGGNLVAPSGTVPLNGEFYEFDQTEFFNISPPPQYSMDDVGYVYVPSRCVSGVTACRLHVVFHGCAMGRHILEDEFARNAGYNEVGELNNIIILYPQVIPSLGNAGGCWDWWGYTTDQFATQEGDQPLATFRMVEKVAF